LQIEINTILRKNVATGNKKNIFLESTVEKPTGTLKGDSQPEIKDGDQKRLCEEIFLSKKDGRLVDDCEERK
jgi:hypothetical protein